MFVTPVLENELPGKHDTKVTNMVVELPGRVNHLIRASYHAPGVQARDEVPGEALDVDQVSTPPHEFVGILMTQSRNATRVLGWAPDVLELLAILQYELFPTDV